MSALRRSSATAGRAPRSVATRAEPTDAAPGAVKAAAGLSPSAPLVPRDAQGRPAALRTLADAARGCTACELHLHATQTVFGEGPERAALMLVGEQPGDSEDRQGHPFVGPAGGVLARGLEAAGIDRSAAYVTNAVKHFFFTGGEGGRRRLHQTPKGKHIKACHGWLDAEIERIEPRIIVALGATAAQALLGAQFRLTQARGQVQRGPGGVAVLATYHPSALLRAPDEARRAELWDAFVTDLRQAATLLAG